MVAAASGGGAVKVEANGQKSWSPLRLIEVLQEDNREMLEDLILAAVNEALRKLTRWQLRRCKSLPAG